MKRELRMVMDWMRFSRRREPQSVVYGVVCGGLLLAAGLSVWLGQARTQTTAAAKPAVGPEQGGTLLICGGGEVPVELRERFYQRAGGDEARIVVIPGVYVGDNDELSRAYLEPWESLGARQIELISARSPRLANTVAFVRAVANATGVWLGGGDQVWLTATYSGTRIEEEIKRVLDRGGVVGGVSAGAAVMSPLMIAGGHGSAVESSGFGLLPDSVIDQHFLQRNRLNRLLGTVSAHPDLIGFGVDEGTALEVCLGNHRLSVLGESYVLACVPRSDDRETRIEILKRGDETTLPALREPRQLAARQTAGQ